MGCSQRLESWPMDAMCKRWRSSSKWSFSSRCVMTFTVTLQMALFVAFLLRYSIHWAYFESHFWNAFGSSAFTLEEQWNEQEYQIEALMCFVRGSPNDFVRLFFYADDCPSWIYNGCWSGPPSFEYVDAVWSLKVENCDGAAWSGHSTVCS